jgi:hypothetical protein
VHDPVHQENDNNIVMRLSGTSRIVLRVVPWGIVLWFLSDALFYLGLDGLVALLGGPVEPPSGWSWEELQRWRQSGEWWRADVRRYVWPLIVSTVLATAVTLATVQWKRRPPIIEA